MKPKVPTHKLEAFYNEGHTLQETSDKFGLAVCTIWQRLKRAGKPIRKTAKHRDRLISRMGVAQYAAHIEKRFPGIVAQLGNPDITMESIGARYGITRERVRQFERRLELPERLELIIEQGKLTKKLRNLNREKRKREKKQRWLDVADRVYMLISSGAPKTEIAAAIPWKLKVHKASFDRRLSLYLYKIKCMTGVQFPAMHHYRPASVKANGGKVVSK